MRNIIFLTLLITSLIIGCGCSNNIKVKQVSDSDQSIRYAKGFRIDSLSGCSLIEISDPTGESKAVYKYAFVNKDSINSVNIPDGYTTIKVPIERAICMTTLQISPFIKLSETKRIAGITSTRFLQNSDINRRIKSGDVKRIGIEGEFDTEVIYDISPDIILTSPFKRGGYNSIDHLDIPMMNYLGYKESSPLGQAEWIKLIGILTGREQQADSIFRDIETKYNELLSLTKEVTNRPIIMSGELHSGNWYVVGGSSYLAQLFRDAGAEYFMKNSNESGGFYVDFETVYAEGHSADYWRIANSHKGDFTYSLLADTDSRYVDFKPFKDKKIIYCNLRQKPMYENTPMEPEILLADLIAIFHPQLLPSDYKGVYYQLLE